MLFICGLHRINIILKDFYHLELAYLAGAGEIILYATICKEIYIPVLYKWKDIL
jgi:hypothetical protein